MEELLGIAMGCMGMSMDDFCRCAPSEFWEAWKAWRDCEARKERGAWERMRMECVCVLQPWSKKRLKARDVMVFAWEEKADGGVDAPMRQHEALSKEELTARYESAKRERGLA